MPRIPSRTSLLVLGMHRSGTSAVSGTLARIGATPPKTLMPSGRDNERGYWESAPIKIFNDELLQSAGSRWSDWRQFSRDWYNSAILAKFKERAKELLVSEFGDAPVFVLKDPRICRFPQLWLDLMLEEGIDVKVIMPVRMPLEVAQSLRFRDGFSINFGLLLWLRHALEAEFATRSVSRSILILDDFLSDWKAAVTRVANETAFQWPNLTEASIAEVDAFLTSELKHENVSSSEAWSHPDINQWVRDTYDALVELSSNRDSLSAKQVLDRVRGQFDDSCRIFGRELANGEQKAIDLEGRVQAQEGELRRIKQQHVVELERRDSIFADYESANTTLLTENSQLAVSISDLTNELARRDATNIALDTEVNSLRGHLWRLRRRPLRAAAKWLIGRPI